MSVGMGMLFLGFAQNVWAQEAVRTVTRTGELTLFPLTFSFVRVVPFLVCIGIVVGFLLARAVGRPRETIRDGWVRRHGTETAILHWINAGGFVLCIVSGLLILGWIKNSISEPLLYKIHYVGAGMILFALSTHLSEHWLLGSKRLIYRKGDFEEAYQEVLGYMGRRKSTPQEPGGKFLATERGFSFPAWSVIVAVILVTGFVKVSAHLTDFPKGRLFWFTEVHDWVTVVAILMLIGHAGAVIAIRQNWPLLKSMFTTKIPEEYVRQHHPGWYEELKG